MKVAGGCFRDVRIKEDAAINQESQELARIFAKSVSTTRTNSRRTKEVPKS